jgi:hypothetical protein
MISRKSFRTLLLPNQLSIFRKSYQTINRMSTRSVIKAVYAQETPEGVGAIVRRSIGTPALRNLSPFLM